MEYMKYAPKELKPGYIELMRDNIWPEIPDSEKQYTHRSVVLIRECGRVNFIIICFIL